jgi:tetraacyldisaccharide 4'-kinase
MSRVKQQMREVVWPRRGLRGWAAWLVLQPATGLFATGVALRNLGYRIGLLRVHRAGIAVISVGNLSVGGTGKTPITLWLAQRLAARGARVAILLRGYRGHTRTVTIVSRGAGPEVDVAAAGDEAVMLAKGFSGPVLTARRRADGVAAAEQLGCDVVVLDDGFQHRALARDFDLVLLNGRSGGLLPAGPMREPASALKRADAVAVVDKGEERAPPSPPSAAPSAPPPTGHASKPVFNVRFVATALVESDGGRWCERPIAQMSGRRVAVVAGIAQPASFYATVRQWEAQIKEIFEYPDHHRYTPADWQRLARDTRDVDLVVTTEKDLAKLEHFPFAKGKLVALRIAPEIEDGDALVRMIMERALQRRDSQEDVNGHQ